MAYSPFPSGYNPALDQFKLISEDTVMYVSTGGNDDTGDGTLSNPYATLSGALTVARKYTILGNAVLTIRLLRGEYTLTDNVDLFHPQGSNIVIEGDPSAFQQRFLYRVQNYTWSLQQFAGSGHTASINLFDGVTTGTATNHGFSADDVGGYFAITNAAIGSRGYNNKSSGGIYSESDTYTNIFYGDRFFNHGSSFEDSHAVLGIGRILGATSDPALLRVEFSNPNIDTRCPALQWDGGINNSHAWGGVAANYPETQYSQPNGYYGNSAWSNPSYPSVPVGDSVNTTDPYILSTYPVVIRSPHYSNKGTLTLKNGSLRAIRNILFASSNVPYTLTNGVAGATLNYSQALTALTHQGTEWTTSGVGLYLDNATVGIRHLGFRGVGTAVYANNSKVIAYYETSAPNSETTYIGTQNTLDNSPVICTTQCKHGIIARNSDINFSTQGGGTRQYYADYRMNAVHLCATSSCIRLYNSNFRATALHLDCVSDIAKFRIDVAVPIFGGSTIDGGETAGFPAYATSTPATVAGLTFFNKYPTAQVFMQELGGSELEVGRINLAKLYSTNAALPSGTTSGASLVGPEHAVAYQRYSMFGVKTAPAGLSYMTLSDFRETVNGGGTLTIRFTNASGVCAQYLVGQRAVLVSGANGNTQGYIGMSTSPYGATAYIKDAWSFGTNEPWQYGSYGSGAVSVRDSSAMVIDKAVVITNGGNNPIDVRKNSSFSVGDHTYSSGLANSSADDYNYPAFTNGILCITSFGGNALCVSENSRASIGTLFAKHPMFAGIDTQANPKARIPVIRVQLNSNVFLGSVYAVTHPGGKSVTDSAVPMWTTKTGVGYGNHQSSVPTTTSTDPLESFVVVTRNSNFMLTSYGSVFSFDGGTADFKVDTAQTPQTPDYAVFAVDRASNLVSPGSLSVSTTASVPSMGTTVMLHDTRTSPQKIMTRSPGTFLYGFSSTRQWTGNANGSGYTAGFTNLGVDNAKPTTAGVTYSVDVSKLGRATN